MASLELVGRYSFIPEAGGNRADDAPVEFICQALSPSEWATAVNHRAVSTGGAGEVQIVTDKEMLVRRAVIEVKNLSADGKQISDAAEFLALRHPIAGQWFDELVNDIIARRMADEEDLKN